MGEEPNEKPRYERNGEQQELLLLLEHGTVEAWNERMEAEVKAGMRLMEIGIDFSRHEFTEYFKFEDRIFPFKINFQGSTFRHTDFSRVVFKERVDFEGATFWFRNDPASYSDEVWYRAGFENTEFYGDANFKNANFNGDVVFRNAKFLFNADFRGASFKGEPTYAGTVFHRRARFNNATIELLDLSGASFKQIPDFRGIADTSGLQLDEVHFTLKRAQDYPARIFEWATGIPTSSSETVSQIRCLRGIAASTHNVDVERDLHVLERSAELGGNWSTWWNGKSRALQRALRWWNADPIPKQEGATTPLMLLPKTLLGTISIVLFRWLSYYGRSATLPAIWLVIATVGFYCSYDNLYQEYPNPPRLESGEERADILWAFTLANALPFGSAARPVYVQSLEKLFCEDRLMPFSFQLTSLAQGLTTVVLLFLVGLGLRNFFRMK